MLRRTASSLCARLLPPLSIGFAFAAWEPRSARAENASTVGPASTPKDGAEVPVEARADPLAADDPRPCKGADVDGDRVCDEVEAATGTELLRADSDADGVPDGVEDADQDGVVDPGESDPRVPGLFPGAYPHVPEPMVFDLVRGLGARKGELEGNTLLVLDLRRGEGELSWAPEVEWVFADGLAVEFELPMRNRELEAMKGAFQATLPLGLEHVSHGVQFIGEYLFDSRNSQLTALYLLGGRAGKWAMLGMLGARAITPTDVGGRYYALINPGIYRDFTEWLTAGVETNIALGLDGYGMLAVIPQVHWQVTRNMRLQLGGGARLEDGNLHPLAATRVIFE